MKNAVISLFLFICTSPLIAQDGTLDATFGTGGIVTTSFGMYSLDEANDLAIQSDGKIIAVGYTADANTNLDIFSMARYNSDGTLDNNFGAGGRVVTSVVADFNCRAVAVDLQTDGKILVAGYANDSNMTATQNGYFAVVRYLSNGTPDSTFGSNGIASFQIAAVLMPDVLLGDMLLQPDSFIVIGGLAYINMVDGDMVFMRLDPNGVPDTAFGTAGTSVQAPPFGGANPTALALQQDGRIVVACLIDAGNHNDPMMTKLNTDGSVDLNFGISGFIFPSYGFSSAFLGVSIQSDGNILACGFADTGAVIARFYDDGLADASFGTGGSVIIPIGSQFDANFDDMIIQPDGKILAAGMADAMFVLVRVTTSGVLDGTFGTGGIVQTQIGSSINDMAHAVELQQDGKIVLAGYSFSMNINSPGVYALARYNNSAAMSVGEQAVSTVNVFPNPASDIITIRSNNPSVVNTIFIYSLTGEVVCSFTSPTPEVKVDISLLPAGVYTIVMSSEGSYLTTELVVVR